jgi:hypothetical protein
LQHVRHEWVFLLDADERCTPGLRREIEALLAREPEHDAYTINRNVFFLGKRIRFSGWQHDRVARLFRRWTAFYENRRVHSLLHTSGPAPILRSIDHRGGPQLRRVRVPARPLRLLGRRAVLARRRALPRVRGPAASAVAVHPDLRLSARLRDGPAAHGVLHAQSYSTT